MATIRRASSRVGKLTAARRLFSAMRNVAVGRLCCKSRKLQSSNFREKSEPGSNRRFV